jgi:peptidylprolyl isomerase
MITALLSLLLAQAAAAQSAGRTQADAKSPSEIVAAAPMSDWRAIPAEDLLVMELEPGAGGRPRRVAIQLMPPPFSQGWTHNIHLLARARWWNGTSVNRVQDNYVAQWGDASEKKPLPPGLNKMADSEYALPFHPGLVERFWSGGRVVAAPSFDARGALPAPKLADPYAEQHAFVGGLPFAMTVAGVNGRGGPTMRPDRIWPVHCYGSVGVGRNLSPDTGTGAELYAVIGHAPRHLDRNIAVVGRVVEGIEHLSSLPRGTEALGFYKTAGERTLIRSIRLASDLPAAERPQFQYLSTESPSFAAYADARANRRDAFFIRPAGGADICNVPVPVRRAP